jgi:hypothetical protein
LFSNDFARRRERQMANEMTFALVLEGLERH